MHYAVILIGLPPLLQSSQMFCVDAHAVLRWLGAAIVAASNSAHKIKLPESGSSM